MITKISFPGSLVLQEHTERRQKFALFRISFTGSGNVALSWLAPAHYLDQYSEFFKPKRRRGSKEITIITLNQSSLKLQVVPLRNFNFWRKMSPGPFSLLTLCVQGLSQLWEGQRRIQLGQVSAVSPFLDPSGRATGMNPEAPQLLFLTLEGFISISPPPAHSFGCNTRLIINGIS